MHVIECTYAEKLHWNNGKTSISLEHELQLQWKKQSKGIIFYPEYSQTWVVLRMLEEGSSLVLDLQTSKFWSFTDSTAVTRLRNSAMCDAKPAFL